MKLKIGMFGGILKEDGPAKFCCCQYQCTNLWDLDCNKRLEKLVKMFFAGTEELDCKTGNEIL